MRARMSSGRASSAGTGYREIAALMRLLVGRRHVAGRHLCAAAEEVLLHLLGEPLARPRVREREPVLVDEHRLMPQPLLPRLFRDVFVDPLAELAWVRRQI